MSEHRLSCAFCERVEPKVGPFLRLVRLGDGRWVCEDCRIVNPNDYDSIGEYIRAGVSAGLTSKKMSVNIDAIVARSRKVHGV